MLLSVSIALNFNTLPLPFKGGILTEAQHLQDLLVLTKPLPQFQPSAPSEGKESTVAASCSP